MSSPVIMTEFDSDTPFSLELLNTNLRALVAAINALNAEPMLQYGATPGVPSGAMPVTGGQFTGQIAAPSILIGPVDGAQKAAVHEGQFATVSTPGIVKRLAPANSDTGAFAVVLPDVSSVFVTSPNADAQGATYSQPAAQSVATLANELKADLNEIVGWIQNTLFPWLNQDFIPAINDEITKQNQLRAGLRSAGVLDDD